MKRNLFIFITLLMIAFPAEAQTVDIQEQSARQKVQDNKLIADISLQFMVKDLDAQQSFVITPVLTSGTKELPMPSILVNSTTVHRTYLRTQALNQRNGIAPEYAFETAFNPKKSVNTLHYSPSVDYEEWMDHAKLSYRIGSSGSKGQVPRPAKEEETERVTVPVPLTHPVPVPLTHGPIEPSNGLHLQGAYIAPTSDDRDKRNKQIYNFKLEEAQVMADISPETLSLYELYTVAQSYKNDSIRFYKLIDTSVRLYPSDPVANMNAAAASLDQNDLKSAAKYLQMASHDNNQYKTNRGVYELLSGNIPEGILYLKQASANGSEEATKNLQLFFAYYRRK